MIMMSKKKEIGDMLISRDAAAVDDNDAGVVNVYYTSL